MGRFKAILGSFAVISLIVLIVATFVQTTQVQAIGINIKSGQPSFHGHTPRGPLGVSRTFSNAVGLPAIHPRAVSNSSTIPSFTVADVNAYLLTHSQAEFTPVQGAHLSVEKVLFVSDKVATQLMNGENPGLADNAVVCFALLKGPFHVQVALPPGTPVGPDPTATEVGEVFDGHTGNLLEWGILDSFAATSPAQAYTLLDAPSVTSNIRPLADLPSTQSLTPNISYNCEPTRCYGANWWTNPVNGAYTLLNWSYLGASFGAGSADGIIRNALWIVDNTTQHRTDCYAFQSDLPSKCFVEAGIKSSIVNGSNVTNLYWADVRPGYYWYEHVGAEINTLFSTSAIDIMIWRAGTISSATGWCPLAGSEWCVDVYSEGDYQQITGVSGAGHTNTMVVSGYQEGMELYGTSGAKADYMYFDDNTWEANNGTKWEYQNNSGDGGLYMQTPPVDSGFSVPPATGNYGGEWFTCLSGAGC